MLFWFQSVVLKVWSVWTDFTSSKLPSYWKSELLINSLNDPFTFIQMIHKNLVLKIQELGIKKKIRNFDTLLAQRRLWCDEK